MISHSPVPICSRGIAFLLLVVTTIFGFLSPHTVRASDDAGLDDDDIDWNAYGDVDGDDAVEYETDVYGLNVSTADDTTAAAESVDVSEMTKGHATVSEVLGRRVGVQVRTLGGPGAHSTLRIRGSDGDQVQIYLDGILLNSGGFSTVNLSNLSLDMFETLEVYRGTTPVFLGLGSIGGALLLKTRDNARGATEFSASYGSWHSGKAMALHSASTNKIRVVTLVSAEGAKGDFKFLNRNGTDHINANDDDDIVSRINNEFRQLATFLKLSTDIGQMKITLFNDFFLKQQGVPGIDIVQAKHASLFSLRELAAVQGEREWHRRHQLIWSVSYMLQQSRFEDPDTQVVTHESSYSEADTISGYGVWRFFGHDQYQFDLRLEGSFDSFYTDSLNQPTHPEPGHRWRLGSGVDLKWLPVSTLKIVPSIRLVVDRTRTELPLDIQEQEPRIQNTEGEYVLPAIGTSWQLSKRFTFISNFGKYVRSPDLFELYGDHGTTTGNSDLVAEEGLNADAGMKYRYERGVGFLNAARLYTGVFGSWSDNLISYVQNSQRTVRAENVSEARVIGAELSLDVTMWSYLGLEGNYTYLQTVNRSDIPYYNGRKLPGRPTHEAYFKVSYIRPVGKWKAGAWLDVDYAGNVYLDQSNLHEDVVGRILFACGLRGEYLPARLTVTLEIRNLLDTISFTDASGLENPVKDFRAYPLPGRSVFATIHWKI